MDLRARLLRLAVTIYDRAADRLPIPLPRFGKPAPAESTWEPPPPRPTPHTPPVVVEEPRRADEPSPGIQVEPGGPSPEEYRAKQSAQSAATAPETLTATETRSAPPASPRDKAAAPEPASPKPAPAVPAPSPNLMALKKAELLARCKAAGITTTGRMTKQQLVDKLNANR